jgi:hypothetical protein
MYTVNNNKSRLAWEKKEKKQSKGLIGQVKYTLWRWKVLSPTSMMTSVVSPVEQILQANIWLKINLAEETK